MMSSLNFRSGVAIAVCLLFGASAVAQTMSSGDFSASKTRIKTEYKADKTACAALFGFGGIAAGAVGIAKILFFVFNVLAVVTFLFGSMKGR